MDVTTPLGSTSCCLKSSKIPTFIERAEKIYFFWNIDCVSKYGDFAKSTNDFFSRDFPSGVVKLVASTQSRSLLATQPGRRDIFSDEFKVTATRDLATGAVAAEVKNVTSFPLRDIKTGTLTLGQSPRFCSFFYRG